MKGLSGACPITSPVSAIIQYISGEAVPSGDSHETVIFQISFKPVESSAELDKARLAGCASVTTDLAHRTARWSPMFTANHVRAVKNLGYVKSTEERKTGI